MKPITEKMLKSGLVDEHTAKLLERWGYLPEGSHKAVPEKDIFEKATRDQLERFAEEIGEEAEKQLKIRETSFELEKLKWPTSIQVMNSLYDVVAFDVPALVDRMGRYYFRYLDVEEKWFTPGFIFQRRTVGTPTAPQEGLEPHYEIVLEKTTLYIDEDPIAIQVTTTPA